MIREDDRPEVVRERLEQYEAQTRPVIDFFREDHHRVFDVDASRERPEAVFGRIQAMLAGMVVLKEVAV